MTKVKSIRSRYRISSTRYVNKAQRKLSSIGLDLLKFLGESPGNYDWPDTEGAKLDTEGARPILATSGCMIITKAIRWLQNARVWVLLGTN